MALAPLRHLAALATTFTAPLLLSGQAPSQAINVVRNDYGLGSNWLCRPGRQDACAVDLRATIISAEGTLTPEAWTPNPNAPIDCFYVYPTVSLQLTPNSNMIAGPTERAVVHAQFARFGSVCRLYAPIYRQVTVIGIRRLFGGDRMTAEQALAYQDVLDAWNYYLAHDNDGRGVVLIGHSQGSNILTELIQNEIDGKPVQARLVSALLPGANIPVPRAADVAGEAFRHLPLCRSASQVGCLISYASFRASAPPPANTLFGRVAGTGLQAACTNPAALGGGSGALHSYLSTGGIGAASRAQPEWVTPAQRITTPFVSVPGMLTAECVSNGHGSYLAITVHPDPQGRRAGDIAGDVAIAGQVQADWGLHLIDMNLAQGNLIDIVRQQGAAYLAAHLKR